jgi:hypothetical protein
MKSISSILLASAVLIGHPAAHAAKAKTQVWTDAADATIPIDFTIQGEYAGERHGAQVIALGDGEFQAVLYSGGLPGAGWDGKNRSLLHGVLKGDKALFKPADGERKYLAKDAAQFSASKSYPPAGHVEFSGSSNSKRFVIRSGDGDAKKIVLKKTVRKSPTLGLKAPTGARVLFDGGNSDAFSGGRLDKKTKLLNTDGKDIRTKDKFNNYTMHIEFMLPYRPNARGQGRGNSGFYQVDHFEVQILDSFGLEGLNNECGGVYTKANPRVNMCLPPLTWQSYDVEFTNAVAKDGVKVSNARMTLKHNGVIIHDNLEITGKTGGSRRDPEGTPGVIKLQGHGNPMQFRNIWVLTK